MPSCWQCRCRCCQLRSSARCSSRLNHHCETPASAIVGCCGQTPDGTGVRQQLCRDQLPVYCTSEHRQPASRPRHLRARDRPRRWAELPVAIRWSQLVRGTPGWVGLVFSSTLNTELPLRPRPLSGSLRSKCHPLSNLRTHENGTYDLPLASPIRASKEPV